MMFLPFEDFWMLRNFPSRIDWTLEVPGRQMCTNLYMHKASSCAPRVGGVHVGKPKESRRFLGSFGASNSKVSDESNLYI